MSVAVVITDRNTDALCELLRQALPGVLIQTYPKIQHPDAVRLAVLWAHPPGITAGMPQLQAVVSMGAGMDHIDADASITDDIPKHRIVTPVLQQNMAQYILGHVLADHRHQASYQQQQKNQRWQVLETDQPMPTIGFLGLGALGGFVADQCAALGFTTLAWTQTRQHPQHRCLQGESGLREVCAGSDYLVVLLPLNQQTEGLINQQTLSWCRPDTMLINVARGAHVVEADLLNALNERWLRRAVLDVFSEEPLPEQHPFWQHPRITLTPHSSARSDVRQTAEAIVRLYQSLPEPDGH
jgi:glyoxylate/hydroxypyruvate reductase A